MLLRKREGRVLLGVRGEHLRLVASDMGVLEGATQRVLLRDMQRHPFKAQLLHLDFQRVDENKANRIRVPLHFLNQEKSTAGKTSGVLISHALTDIEIACLPKDLPVSARRRGR